MAKEKREKNTAPHRQTISAVELARRKGWTLDWTYRQLWVGRIEGAEKVNGEWRILDSEVHGDANRQQR